ncbi:MAG TPA: PhoH family protein [bacterium]|nr:PhoH family protein [bacterium]
MSPTAKRKTITDTVDFASDHEALGVLGPNDRNLHYIRSQTGAKIIARGTHLRFIGTPDEVQQLVRLFTGLRGLVRRGVPVEEHEIDYMMGNPDGAGETVGRAGAVDEAREAASNGQAIESRDNEAVITADASAAGKLRVRPKSEGQREYLEVMEKHEITFAVGPAGTGKTYLATAMAVSYLLSRRVQRIILTRPAVEAGESLGFLPGDLYEKVAPYFRPLYDSLYDMLGVERCRRLIDNEIIEVAPLAYMRGRTLNKAFIILDEAQNTTPKQMKMFLTRMGPGSRMVITGDPTQNDLVGGQQSGLVEALRILKDVPDIGKVHLRQKDIIRHQLVQQIVDAYDKFEGVGQPNGAGTTYRMPVQSIEAGEESTPMEQ